MITTMKVFTQVVQQHVLFLTNIFLFYSFHTAYFFVFKLCLKPCKESESFLKVLLVENKYESSV